MAERATVFQRSQLGVESVAGTHVAATKQLQSLSFDISANIESQRVRPAGSKSPTIQTVGRKWSTLPISGSPTYDEQVYAWASVISNSPPLMLTQGVYRWQFSMNNFAADTTSFYTIEHGSAERAARATGVHISEFGYSISKTAWSQNGSATGRQYEDGVSLSSITMPQNQKCVMKLLNTTGGVFTLTVGTETTDELDYDITASAFQAAIEDLDNVGIGNVVVVGESLIDGTGLTITFVGKLAGKNPGDLFVDVNDLTGDPTPSSNISISQTATMGGFLPVVPMEPSTVDCYLATSYEGLDAAQPLDYMLDSSWKISNRFGQTWPLKSSYKSFQSSVELEPKIDLSFTVKANSNGMALLQRLEQSDTVFFRVAAQGPVIKGNHSYTFVHDTALKVSAIGGLSDNGGVYAASFSGEGVYDAGWGKSTEITLVNTVGNL